MDSNGLFLIGIGPGGVSNMTEGAISAARDADHRRYEAYTALWSQDDLSELEDRIGPIEKIMRPEVERPDGLLELATTSSVALLVVGDPLQATTHVDLQLQASWNSLYCNSWYLDYKYCLRSNWAFELQVRETNNTDIFV